MLVTKNIIIKPQIFPVIGESNKFVNEISRRFVKYYKRGVKNTNRNKLLGYSLLLPKSLTKFEAVFREDLMMLEVKVNKKSSVLIPSYYTSTNTFKRLFELNDTNKLKNIYSFKNGKAQLNIVEHIDFVNEAVPDEASSEISSNKEINLGKADHIKNFTKDFLVNHYGDIGMAKFWDSLTSWDDRGAGKILKYTSSQMFKLFKHVSRAWQGDNIFKDEKYKEAIAANDKAGMKNKTKVILNKMLTGDSSEKSKFIDEAIKIFDSPENINGWLNNLTSIKTDNLLAEEQEIFDAITKLFNISLDFGSSGVPKNMKDARAQEAKEPAIAHRLTALHHVRSGILRGLYTGSIRKQLNKIKPLFGTKFSYSVADFDREISSKILKHTKDLDSQKSKALTREMSEGFFGYWLKASQKIIIPATYQFLILVTLTGINPETATIEEFLDTIETPISETLEISRPSQGAAAVKAASDQGYERGKAESDAVYKKEIEKLTKANETLEASVKAVEKGAGIVKAIEGLDDVDICALLNRQDINAINEFDGASDTTNLFIKMFSTTCEYSVNGGFSYKQSNPLMSLYKKISRSHRGDFSPDEQDILEGILKVYYDLTLNDYTALGKNDQTVVSVKNLMFYTVKNLGRFKLDKTSNSANAALSVNKDLAAKFGALKDDLLKASKEMKDVLNNSAKDEGGDQNANIDSSREQQLDAVNQNVMQIIDDAEKAQIASFTEDRYKAVGSDLSKRWESNIKSTDSRFVSVFREISFLPLNVFLTVAEAIEGRVTKDAEWSKTMTEWNQNKANMNRSEALCLLMWYLVFGGYFRKSNMNLGEYVRQIYVEILGSTNVFKLKPVQIAIQTIQMVSWASLSEEFKSIVSVIDDVKDESEASEKIKSQANFTPDEVATLGALLQNLDGISVKKDVMNVGELHVAGIDVNQINSIGGKEITIPLLRFTYKKPSGSKSGSNSLKNLNLPPTD